MSLLNELGKLLPAERIKSRLIDRIAFASDAGFYHLVPQVVVQPESETEIIQLFRISQQQRVPIVFRTGGTSLSGQSITDGILVDLSQYWRRVTVEQEGERVRVQPGITGAMVNAHLRRYKRKIGPDPSSISAAMMGGILSNNASGMCCGVRYNSYHTTRAIRFILSDGQSFSTEDPADYERFVSDCAPLAAELRNLRKEILNDAVLQEKIRSKYRTKNTVGYSLNALLDYEHPLDIFAHLLIGAEGTLAFIASAVLETIPDQPCKATALLYFPNIFAACSAIAPLIDAGAEMVELMDRASLRSIEHMKGIDSFIATLPGGAAALLIEFQEATDTAIDQRVDQFLASAAQLALLNPPVFTRDAEEREFLWKVRKGLFPAVGAVRASGTTVILEDVAFPLHHLGHAILDLQQLFAQYEYDNAIIFGHAKDGNIHFVVTQAFDTPAEVERYDRFLRDVVSLVVSKYDGTLKAEHGTGRNMAPFVETEWGGAAYAIMKRIKQAADPQSLLNPGVIINDDPEVHIRNLKPLPAVEEEVDKCIECGYCEHRCPSRDLTLTPRQRIVVRRALTGMQAAGQQKEYRELLNQYQYDGLETCAVDGLCAGACPVDINTGDLVKRLRRENHSARANKLALQAARHFGKLQWAARSALTAGNTLNKIFGKKTMPRMTGLFKRIIPSFPLWTNELTAPPALKALRKQPVEALPADASAVVYFPSCISRMMGAGQGDKKNILDTFLAVSAKAGITVVVSKPLLSGCCGQIFSSKGYAQAYRYTAARVAAQLWEASDQGRIPVVMDVSSCTFTLLQLGQVLEPEQRRQYEQLRILDSIDYLEEMVLPRTTSVKKKDRIVLHPVCALEKTGGRQKFIRLARQLAYDVQVPMSAGCCGMAGDRGFLFPELTTSATRAEAKEVMAEQYDGYYSSTKTCEMALSAATQRDYESILYLADETLNAG
ncbi:MAG: FAD-binding and (Fe-S)-binding domain-containing protein [Chitinophagaceae bacterium]